MFQTKVVEKIKAHFIFDNFFFEILDLFEVTWKNIVDPGRPQMIIWRMRIACRIAKATNTRSAYVIIVTFPPQQWIHERATMLR